MSESNYSKNMKVTALQYNSEKDTAPVVVAAGGGYVAQKILEIADEYGIAVYHDDTAATLLSKLDLGQEIPPELYQIVVSIYLSILGTAKNSRQELGIPIPPKGPAKAGETAPTGSR
ncbi:EscU/YscU/HrcU family type III secretion system export apparatus switch protein [Oscillospiraceae bacterium MB08-C2-2]|nr:EscU/YscU/HrcU family type III secretion system export apparatus switch protein [Oscillospiraceae bacterium MB08-C2-2]